MEQEQRKSEALKQVEAAKTEAAMVGETPPPFDDDAIPELDTRPPLELLGHDGNAFGILGRAIKTLKRNHYSQARIDEFLDEAKSGDYDHLLGTCMKWFEVE